MGYLSNRPAIGISKNFNAYPLIALGQPRDAVQQFEKVSSFTKKETVGLRNETDSATTCCLGSGGSASVVDLRESDFAAI